MTINIFGVGRSGTTGLQLYLSYLLAKKEGKVRINSEPYIWQTRKGPKSYYGQKIFLESGHILEETATISKKHQAYLDMLSDYDVSTVNKFIRGNGMIKQINQTMKPDLTILVYRDVREVLRSLDKYNWRYTDIHNRFLSKEQSTYWNDFKQNNYVQKVIQKFGLDLSEIEQNKELRTVLYWYVNNIKALEYNEKDTYHIEFSKIEMIEEIVKEYYDGEIYPIKNALFFGDNLNKEMPLEDFENENILTRRVKTRIDEFSFFLERTYNIPAYYLEKRCGSVVKVAEEAVLLQQKHKPQSTSFENNEAYHPISNLLRNDLFLTLKQVKYNKLV